MRLRDAINIVEAAARGADLYHGTSIWNAGSIVKQGRMTADDSHGDTHGISFSRSEAIAWDFAELAETREMGDAYAAPRKMIGAVLVLDGPGLRAAFGRRLADYAWDGDDSEEEERLHGREGILDIRPYLREVRARAADLQWWSETVPDLVNMLSSLASDPRFRAI